MLKLTIPGRGLFTAERSWIERVESIATDEQRRMYVDALAGFDNSEAQLTAEFDALTEVERVMTLADAYGPGFDDPHFTDKGARTMNPTDLTPGSLDLLEALWEDRHNWAGMPLFGGNVGGSPASLGHLTDLKKKGYVTTEVDYEDPSLSWVIFTDKTYDLFHFQRVI